MWQLQRRIDTVVWDKRREGAYAEITRAAR